MDWQQAQITAEDGAVIVVTVVKTDPTSTTATGDDRLLYVVL